jgi:hypothetical protein
MADVERVLFDLPEHRCDRSKRETLLAYIHGEIAKWRKAIDAAGSTPE